MIRSFRNVLVLGAHPDDEVLGAGGTIPLLKRHGAHVTVGIVTDGSTAQYPGDDAVIARKDDALQRANAVLGTDEVVQLPFPDMRLDSVNPLELNGALERLLRERDIDTVFVHSEDDINLDHQLVHRALMVAARPYPGQTVRNVLAYWVSSASEWGARRQERAFCPNVYVDISETLPLKLEAMACYADELRPWPHPRSLEALEHRARTTGTEVGYEAAEPFRLLLSRVSPS